MFETKVNSTATLSDVWKKRPLVISGPCSAETEEQLIQTAIALQAIGKVDVLRAGIWKPRTRPGNFEGVGEIGLSWLKKAKEITGLPNAIEVANAKQVELALMADVDILWIGARSTANPFSVQELADALKGVKVPIFIKNPINPDIELWIGALERLQKSGIEQIGLIHRGFSAYGNSEFRNAPTWQLAIEMKRRYSSLPFLIDPSHICGNRHLLKGVVQNAIDLDYNGVIIESHIHPDDAWSDAQQQITPLALQQLLGEIIWRKDKISAEKSEEDLERFRRIIDHLDDEILLLLGKRMNISEDIGNLKRENGVTILQTERWNKTLERLAENAKEIGLSPDFINQYFNAIHMESIRHQDKVMNFK